MSGGVFRNSSGEVIAVLGKGKNAILNTAYDYHDNTIPTAAEIKAFKEVGFSIPIVNIKELSPQLASLLPGNNNADLVQKAEYTGIVRKITSIHKK